VLRLRSNHKDGVSESRSGRDVKLRKEIAPDGLGVKQDQLVITLVQSHTYDLFISRHSLGSD